MKINEINKPFKTTCVCVYFLKINSTCQICFTVYHFYLPLYWFSLKGMITTIAH